jgi:hypothetical protein
MPTSCISQIIAIRLKLESPQPVKVQEAFDLLFQLWLENKNNPDFILELEEIAENHPTLMQEIETRYQTERGTYSDTAVTQIHEDKFKSDVFISYSHKDEKWTVDTLLPNLEKVGLKVCIDFRDFKAGKAALFNMQDSAKEGRHVVLVLTQNWLNSEWSFFEALIAGTKDPAGLQQKIIPLLCEAGIEKDIPDFISMRTWVDFTRKDREAIAWQQLFNACNGTAELKLR